MHNSLEAHIQVLALFFASNVRVGTVIILGGTVITLPYEGKGLQCVS